jgi:hypothetical protein
MLGDSSAPSSAFMSLCVNVVDAMPENRTLTLYCRNVDWDWVEMVAAPVAGCQRNFRNAPWSPSELPEPCMGKPPA